MFKTKEELIDKHKAGIENFEINEISCSFDTLYNNGLNKGIDISFKSFAERVEFDKKYRNDVKQFLKDYPKYYNNSQLLWNNFRNYSNTDEWYNDFNDWLFDYCFGDIK